MSIDGYEHKATIEIVENGFIVSYKTELYRHKQKVFYKIEDALDFVRSRVFPTHVADRHPGMDGKEGR